MIVHLILITHELTLDETQTATFIELQASLHVEATEPRPCGALMVGVVTLGLRTDIHRVVAATLRRERTQSLRCQQLTGAYIHHTLHLLLAQRRVVESHSEDHVRTHAPVHHIAIHIVEQVTIFIDKSLHKRSLCLLSQCLQLLCVLGVTLLGCHRGTELQGVVPQGIELYDITGTRHYRTAVGGGVHPCHSTVTAIGIKQTVIVEAQVGMTTLDDIVNNIADQLAITLIALLLSGILHILLDGPDSPEGHIWLFDLIDLHRQRFPLHELTETFLRCSHHQLKVIALVNGQRQSRQSDERVAGASRHAAYGLPPLPPTASSRMTS